MSFIAGYAKSLSNEKTQREIGIGGFVGFARTSESIKYSSTLPTEVREDGSTAGDDIITNPIVVTMDGDVGDIIVEDRQFPEIVPKDITNLGMISALFPAESQQQLQRVTQINDIARDAILEAERVERIGQNVYDYVAGNVNIAKSIQQKFVDYMEGIHFARVPIKISVSYKNYENMGLQDLTINRNNTDGSIKFSATFMEMPLAQLVYTEVTNALNPSNPVIGKTASQADNGGQNPETNTESVLSAVFG